MTVAPMQVEPGGAVLATEAAERAGRVLDAFEQRARRVGIRAVVMSDLARDLGMSTKTLYRSYASKAALVAALVDRWSARFLEVQERRLARELSDLERVRVVVHHTVRWRTGFCEQFWTDLRRDHPEAWNRHASMTWEARRRVGEWLVDAVRPGLDPEFARALLSASVERALQPEVRRASGMSRAAAIDAAVDLWVHGALRPPEPPRSD